MKKLSDQKKMNDEDLMTSYQQGDLDAFNVLYARHKNKVYGYLVKRLRNPSSADEVFQNAFVKLHRKKHQYDNAHPFLKWLFIVTRSEMLDWVKRQKSSVEFNEEAHTSQEQESLDLIDLDSVDTLSENEKFALSLRYYEDHDFYEIAQKLEISQSNARKIISRGIKKLKKALTGENHEK